MKPQQDDVLIGLICATLIFCVILVAITTKWVSAKHLKIILVLKAFNLSASLFVLILSLLARLPFAGVAEFILVFIASVLSVCSHSFDFAKKSFEPTKRPIISEVIIFGLYVAGIIMLFNINFYLSLSNYTWSGVCRVAPVAIGSFFGVSSDRNICAAILAILGFGKFTSTLGSSLCIGSAYLASCFGIFVTGDRYWESKIEKKGYAAAVITVEEN